MHIMGGYRAFKCPISCSLLSDRFLSLESHSIRSLLQSISLILWTAIPAKTPFLYSSRVSILLFARRNLFFFSPVGYHHFFPPDYSCFSSPRSGIIISSHPTILAFLLPGRVSSFLSSRLILHFFAPVGYYHFFTPDYSCISSPQSGIIFSFTPTKLAFLRFSRVLSFLLPRLSLLFYASVGYYHFFTPDYSCFSSPRSGIIISSHPTILTFPYLVEYFTTYVTSISRSSFSSKKERITKSAPSSEHSYYETITTIYFHTALSPCIHFSPVQTYQYIIRNIYPVAPAGLRGRHAR